MTKEEAVNHILEASSDKNKSQAFMYVRKICSEADPENVIIFQEELDEKLNG